ncbi:MAG: hypothetical protein ACOH2F_14050 [Cellulomonas sp.]
MTGSVAGPPSVARVGSFALVLPPDWWTIPLAEERARRRSVDALVEHQFGHADASAVLKGQTRDALRDVADRAGESGGRLLAISLMRAAGLPLSTTLITYRLGGSDLSGAGVRELDARLRASSPESVSLDLGEVPAGLVLRKMSRRAGPADLGATETDQLLVEYWIEPTGGGALLYLVFTTPHLELSEAMTDLFDAIAAGVTLVDD